VGEDVIGDRARERVLGVGVEVDLHDPVSDRLAHLITGGAATAVKDVLKASPGTPRGQRRLAVGQHARAQGHVAGRVDAVHVAEGGGQQVAAALARAQRLDHPHQVLGGGVELGAAGPRAGDAVLLAAHDAALELEHDAQRRQLL
jgi:hypothetical protein